MSIFKGTPAVVSVESLYYSQPPVLRILHNTTHIQWGAGTNFRAERLKPQGWFSAVDRMEGRDGALCLTYQCQHSFTVPTCIANRCCLGFMAALSRAWDRWNSSGHVSPTSWSRIVTRCYAIFTCQGRGGNPNHDCCLDIAQGLICVLALKMYQRGSHIARKGILCSDASYNAEEETLRNRRWLGNLSADNFSMTYYLLIRKDVKHT
jgi:hypothetical protein